MLRCMNLSRYAVVMFTIVVRIEPELSLCQPLKLGSMERRNPLTPLRYGSPANPQCARDCGAIPAEVLYDI